MKISLKLKSLGLLTTLAFSATMVSAQQGVSKADITFSRSNQEVLATYGRESAPLGRLFKYRCSPASRCSIVEQRVSAPDQKECQGLRR